MTYVDSQRIIELTREVVVLRSAIRHYELLLGITDSFLDEARLKPADILEAWREEKSLSRGASR